MDHGTQIDDMETPGEEYQFVTPMSSRCQRVLNGRQDVRGKGQSVGGIVVSAPAEGEYQYEQQQEGGVISTPPMAARERAVPTISPPDYSTTEPQFDLLIAKILCSSNALLEKQQ